MLPQMMPVPMFIFSYMIFFVLLCTFMWLEQVLCFKHFIYPKSILLVSVSLCW